jgi:HAD superfamily hydrolase (TIGR01484 family)
LCSRYTARPESAETPMRFRALAIDLDGTLLVGEELPAANRDAVRAAVDAGLEVVIATARWHQMATRVGREIGLEGPVIACSGAQVHLPAESRDIFDERLPADFVAELFAICDAERCVATVTFDREVLLKLDGAPDRSQMPPEMHWVPRLTGADPAMPRVAAIQGSAVNARIRAELEPRYEGRVHFFDSIGPSGKVILTITAATASKGAALSAACAHLGVDPREVVAFGDAENDLEMFRVAGASVAMGQALPFVKSAATWVTSRNDDAGVAKAIRRLLATGSAG